MTPTEEIKKFLDEREYFYKKLANSRELKLIALCRVLLTSLQSAEDFIETELGEIDCRDCADEIRQQQSALSRAAEIVRGK